MDYNLYKGAFIAIPECKYRLPCGWCERVNDLCSLYASYKEQIDDVPRIVCDHHWESCGDDIYRCSRCGELMKKTFFASTPQKLNI